MSGAAVVVTMETNYLIVKSLLIQEKQPLYSYYNFVTG